MTKIRQVVDLTPPDYYTTEQHLESEAMECGYCHGRGTFAYDERWGDDVVKICPVCKGCGRVSAEISIRWTPSERNTPNPIK